MPFTRRTAAHSGPLPHDAAWPRGLAIHFQHVDATRAGVRLLQSIDLTFEPDRRYVLIGPSGAGKSSLLRLLNRLDDPSAGQICLGKTPYPSLPIAVLRRGVGLVFQASRPLPGSLADNLAFPFEVRGLTRPDRPQLAEALEEVGLEPSWLERDASGLSGGERQRLALAVALQADPEILALDEPTAALDPVSARLVADVLGARVRSSGLRTIAVCHHRQQAAWLGDHAVVLNEGRVVDGGPLHEVLTRCDAAVWSESDRDKAVP